jgi:CRISPR-associated protein Cas5d
VGDYDVSLEIEGPAAIFTRPDTGAAPVSYPAPTYSAAKGIFEAIARLRSAYIHPTSVEICRPIQYASYTTNYGGPLRKSNQRSKGASYQLPATILVDVCYRIHGEVRAHTTAPGRNNHLHALQEIFTRRLGLGQCHYTPCLGWKEFVASYVGPLRRDTQADASINLTIPSMLHSVFDSPVNGRPGPRFVQNVRIEQGVLRYAE